MFEVIISNVNSGRVWRRLFDSHEAADGHVERFFDGGTSWPRNRRNYRVEVHVRPAPVVRSLARTAVEEAA